MDITWKEDPNKGKNFVLLECPVCKTKISSTAERCYSCGSMIDRSAAKQVAEAPPPPMRKWEE